MTKKLIDAMVDRFLGWKLPEDFNPDCGISFKRDYNEGTQWPMKHEPIGTNLLNAIQAKAMIEHLLSDIPDPLFSCLDDPAKSAALGVIAEALPDLLILAKEAIPKNPHHTVGPFSASFRRLELIAGRVLIAAIQATKEETK